MKTRYLAGVAAVAAAATLSACGGGSKNPGVASLNGSNGSPGVTTTTLPHGSPSQLLNEWAQCMRQNGFPSLADPTIDANGTIHIVMPKGAAPPSAPDKGSSGGGAAPVDSGGNVGIAGGPDSGPCGAYLTAASTALRGGQPLQKPNPRKLEAFARCMRAHGIADFPDPQAGGALSLHSGPGSDLDPNNPTFSSASKTCAKSAGVPQLGGGPQRGGIMVTSGGGVGPGSAGEIQQGGN